MSNKIRYHHEVPKTHYTLAHLIIIFANDNKGQESHKEINPTTVNQGSNTN